jgi:hypothetical protein
MTGQAPPVPTYSAPGMPRPVELPEHLQRNFRTRWMESVLGSALVLLLIVVASAGGFVLVRTVWANRPPARDTEADGSPSAASTTASTAASKAAPSNVPILAAPAKPLAESDRLPGVWESRADDGSQSGFDFQPDGQVIIVQAGNPRPPSVRTFWYPVDQRGDDVTIEIGPEFGGVGNYRYVLRFTAPDAFTMTRIIRYGAFFPEELRYVRVGPSRGVPPATKKSATDAATAP